MGQCGGPLVAPCTLFPFHQNLVAHGTQIDIEGPVVALERNVPGGGGLKLTQRTLLPHSITVLFSSSLFDGRHRKTGRHRRDPPDPSRRRGQPLHRHRLWYAPHPMLPFSICL